MQSNYYVPMLINEILNNCFVMKTFEIVLFSTTRIVGVNTHDMTAFN